MRDLYSTDVETAARLAELYDPGFVDPPHPCEYMDLGPVEYEPDFGDSAETQPSIEEGQ